MTDTANRIREILVTARARIAKPENWTKGAFARDAGGSVAPPLSERATCWCAEGAIRASRCGYETRREVETFLVLKGFGGSHSAMPCAFNDELTHTDVLAAFDRAIAAAGPV